MIWLRRTLSSLIRNLRDERGQIIINRISSGAGIVTKNITGSATLDFPSIPDGGISELTFTLTGALVGAPVIPQWPVLATGLDGTMFVSAADTIKVRLTNLSGGPVDPASATYGARIIQ